MKNWSDCYWMHHFGEGEGSDTVSSWLPRLPVGQIVINMTTGVKFINTGSKWVSVDEDMKDWELFLDDERMPSDAGWAYGHDIKIARSSKEAEDLVNEHGLPTAISFDHDLGGEDTAFKFMWWLINGHLDDKWNLARVKAVQIHSANPEGAKKLMALWDNFCRVHNIDVEMKRVWPGVKE